MLTVISFLLALGVLIAVHEYGHYRMAVACGVKVLRFSVGFGRPLLRWTSPRSGTEFVLAAFPLGGYVKMLDEREAPVGASERHLAFNTQSLRKRAAIVAAGPVANLLLAILLYAVVNWVGVTEPRAILGSPVPGSVAAQAGLTGGETVREAAFDEEPTEPVRSFEDLRWRLTRAALDGHDLTLGVGWGEGGATRRVQLNLSALQGTPETVEVDARLFRRIGILGPLSEPRIGELQTAGAAERDGLHKGDLVKSVGGRPVVDAQQLREAIRASVSGQAGVAQEWRIDRHGQVMTLSVTPDARAEGGVWVGRIGAYVGAPAAQVTVRYGLFDGLWRGMRQVWDVSTLTLRMMGRMVTGAASLKNLSGPLTIADYAGKSASLGLAQYLIFLALISVSLGVLNLLPLPVLDGGHLMYYLWEGITGKGISDVWMDRLQRSGVAVLLVMMSIALFNDVTRLFG